MFLALLVGCAAHMFAPPYDPGLHGPSVALSELYADTPRDEVFQQAIVQRQTGDMEGAILRLVWLELGGDTDPKVLYQLALAYEGAEDHTTALSVYDRLLSRSADVGVQRDAGFRRALCLLELGWHEAAVDQLQSLPGGNLFDPKDRYTYDLGLGVALLRAGKQDKGIALINTTLEATAGTDLVPWMRSMGWHALAVDALAQAAKKRLDMRLYRRAGKNLTARAALIAEAEQYLVEMVKLTQPDWIMKGMRDLGDAYVAVHEQLNASPAPRRLNDDADAMYQEIMAERSHMLLGKAWKAYDQGLDIAGRFGMIDTRRAQELRERRDAITL
jgi:tetratricopeptide (TPR) repeat protein